MSVEFICKNCFRKYKHSTSLYKHVKYECGKEPQFKCPYCPHRSKIKPNLKSHIARKHFGFSFMDFENECA